MLGAFQRKRWVMLLFFYNIIYHGNALFSSARVRVCEEFFRKIGENRRKRHLQAI